MSGDRPSDVLRSLQDRGLVSQSTDPEALGALLAEPGAVFYCGFDPTAPSLHVGHLVPLLTMRRLQEAGHRPLALVGGATGLIGDPRPSGERQLHAPDVVAGWADRLRAQIGQVLDFEGPHAARMVDNLDWTAGLSAIDFLRDVGKHFRVNRMLAKESVAARLASDAGISFTEFSYALLQSLDFLELLRRHDCRLQIGGNDQWGNLASGVDYVGRAAGTQVHAFTTPLVTKSDGTKFGKSEGGAVWLDPGLTSPYAFHQFWLNADDRDVLHHLRVYTWRTEEELAELATATAERPGARAAQRALADDVTALVHGSRAAEQADLAGRALFGSGDLSALDEDVLAAAVGQLPTAEVPAGSTATVVDLLVATGLSASRSAARRTVQEGGAYLNNAKVADAEEAVRAEDALPGGWFVVRRGRKSLAGARLVR